MSSSPCAESAGRERALGAAAAALGTAPFLAGAAAYAISGHRLDAAPAACVFRAVTGLPCPMCGSTRAFMLASHGDWRFLDYNAVWVFVAILLVLGGLAMATLGRRPLLQVASLRRATALRLAGHARLRAAAIALALAVPWAYALAHRGTIVT